MTNRKITKRIAILGAGPSGLFMLKRLVEAGQTYEIHFFEKTKEPGAGMPYGSNGANKEHITNVSANELPELPVHMDEWISSLPRKTLVEYNIDPDHFNEYRVVPRLLFGRYLEAQFYHLRDEGRKKGLQIHLHLGTEVTNVTDQPEENKVLIETKKDKYLFDMTVICTGHHWPKEHEGKIPGYFDSPYPPSKLELQLNHPVAIMGSSLTAIDAIRTLARHNGTFEKQEDGRLAYHVNKESSKFRIVMHSKNGLLPAVRVHLEAPQLSPDSLLPRKVLDENKKENGGFLSLDFLFDKSFKNSFKEKDPAFYKRIKDMNLEKFVNTVMEMRSKKEPFELFKAEYAQAEQSIEDREPVHWKEMLAELSYALNLPAKYLSAEDTIRLQKILMPLISIVIAFVPQSSCEELFALHDAGKLKIVSVGADSEAIPQEEGGVIYQYTDDQGKKHKNRYQTFVSSIGQRKLSLYDIPFEGLRMRRSISQAYICFQNREAGEEEMKNGNEHVVKNAADDYVLKVPGITINDYFQIVNEYGIPNPRIYMMAVPYIGGYNPDYSGLDLCDSASACIIECMKRQAEELNSAVAPS